MTKNNRLIEAEMLIENNQLNKARKILEEMLIQDPKDIDNKNDLAVVEIMDSNFDKAIGYAGSKPRVYTWFEKLMQLAEDDELILLTNHSSPTVRGYSFWALVERDNPKVKGIMLEHFDDSVYIDRMSGCIGYQEKLNDFLFSIVSPNCINADCSRLPPEDIAEIKAKMK